MNLREKISRNYALVYKVGIFSTAMLLLLLIFPKEAKFRFDYHQGKPWPHNDLMAPFDFAILKSDSALKAEQGNLQKNLKPYYQHNSHLLTEQLRKLKNQWSHSEESKSNKLSYTALSAVLSRVYEKGVIEDNEFSRRLDDPVFVEVNEDASGSERFLSEVFNLSQAKLALQQYCDALGSNSNEAYTMLEPLVQPDISFDAEKTASEKQLLLDHIPLTFGLLQKGEKIISKGEVVNDARFMMLESLRHQYEKQGEGKSLYLVLGQVLLISLSMIVFALFLYSFRRDIYNHNKKIVFLLFLITLMVGITSIVAGHYSEFLYMVPICMVPLMVRVFFDTRLALFVHLITIILIGFLVPNSFEFIFSQLITGIITIISVVHVQRRAQFFLTSLLILLSYNLTHIGILLIEDASLQKMYLSDSLMYGVSALTTLSAYPLIYLFERIFGFVTNISLMELADTNNPVLRKLSMHAPGTFQHSLQVANLAEEAVYRLNGNSLLVRVGALYHDIGKIEMPQYYIENLGSAMNPHLEISPRESAAILIQHVIRGVEIARRNKIPEPVIDFIRTHHGTKRTEYFYSKHLEQFPDETGKEAAFTYRGPLPVSLETCILMMADSVEAASRSIKDPDEEKLSRLVDQVVEKQFENDQFIQAEISFKEIALVKKIFREKLLNIYHIRETYPNI